MIRHFRNLLSANEKNRTLTEIHRRLTKHKWQEEGENRYQYGQRFRPHGEVD